MENIDFFLKLDYDSCISVESKLNGAGNKGVRVMARIIGYFKQSIIELLNLNGVRCDTPIYLGESNVEHMKKRHPYEYDKYFSDISEIISEPDYVGVNPSDNSIGFVKEYFVSGEYVRVAVRVTMK
ncbi:MAG: hypothetical protein Q4F29_02685, partial [Lachnospiraceae bacterium]|nr:hypothetical protein [Lachnospiraceae bacterium]